MNGLLRTFSKSIIAYVIALAFVLAIIAAPAYAFGLSGEHIAGLIVIGASIFTLLYTSKRTGRIALAAIVFGPLASVAFASSWWNPTDPIALNGSQPVIVQIGVPKPTVVTDGEEALRLALRTNYMITCDKQSYAASKLSKQPSGLVVELASKQIITLPKSCTSTYPKVGDYKFITVE